MANALVIVESPTKAKKIAEYLGSGFTVESSIGHVRDLPRNAADVPKAYKAEKWARTGIDVDNGFKPLYVENRDKKDHIKLLKSLLKDADELYLATDEDREGEAIAWHLIEVLNPQVPVKRMVFHEITEKAIQAAIEEPRELDRKMVDAQEARRILDRLYGYEVSPVLWKKVMPQLSAGRVQSVGTRLVVERERERMAFIAASYWDVKGVFAAADGGADGARPQEFSASLAQIDGARLASGRDFADDGTLARDDVVVLDEAGAAKLVDDLEGVPYEVRSRESKPYRRRPAAPFITSTFQQEAGRKLGLSSAMAMRAAQGLYEKGYITYMRTDSTTLSDTALAAAKTTILERYGDAFYPADGPRLYTKKSKNAQEAHEAIRPAGDTFKTPDQVAAEVPISEARVYELIWKRTVASQMTDCTGETVQLRLGATSAAGADVEFTATGTVIQHRGIREVYEESKEAARNDDEAAGDDDERRLPPLEEGDAARATGPLEFAGHETQPPSRYTEASLVKRLEELGVGRPSTYASIIGTIQDRGYVWKKGSALVPSFTAFSVVNVMEGHFPNLVDYAFTAKMEDDLDKIASGAEFAEPWLTRFYFGEGNGGEPGLKEKVSTRLPDIDARAVNTIPLGMSDDGKPVVARVGRYGPYVQLGDSDEADDNQTASIPDDIPPDELTLDKAMEYLSQPKEGRILGSDPETGLDVYAKAGRFGPYVQVGAFEDFDGTDEKPKTASLFQSMDLETVTLDDAMKLLSLPRTVGADPADGEVITVQNGRYGPYLKKGKDSRSLQTEEQLLTITLDECLKILAEPKRGRGQTAKPPLREMGPDPESGKDMIVKDGRFGPYVTDGEYNASLRKGDTVEELTVERAAELLADRRAKGPAKKARGAKKKAAKKKAGKKKASKKKAGKKASKASTKKAAKTTAAESASTTAETEAAADPSPADTSPPGDET